MLGWILTVIGAIIRLASYRELGRLFTFDLSIRKGHKLVTTGPYSYIRHPSYTGAILGWTGTALCLLREGSWAKESGALNRSPGYYINNMSHWSALVVPLGLARRTYLEDRILKEEFQEQWEQWVKKVPYKLFPGVF